jgi:carboxypeptidase family protein
VVPGRVCGRLVIAGILWLAWLDVRAASSQTVGSMMGAVSGTVTDATGAVLAGVTVLLKSDALIGSGGSRSASTNADGFYQFQALAPGDYHVAFSLAGFRRGQPPISGPARKSGAR